MKIFGVLLLCFVTGSAFAEKNCINETWKISMKTDTKACMESDFGGIYQFDFCEGELSSLVDEKGRERLMFLRETNVFTSREDHVDMVNSYMYSEEAIYDRNENIIYVVNEKHDLLKAKPAEKFECEAAIELIE